MVFSSVIFLFFFLPLFLIVYHFIDHKYKNGFTLLSSLLFYAWGSPDFLLIALASIVIDFFIIKQMDTLEEGRKKLIFLWLSILLNTLILLYFKYANFFIENVNQVLVQWVDHPIKWTKIILPIGISFYTFQKISYSVDIYKKVKPPLQKLTDYALYIMLFPQLIAGPIVRYKEIAEQITKRVHDNHHEKLIGVFRFSIGLAKKMLIANVVGKEADAIFALNSIDISSTQAWIGIICYTFQIYFDFSAYSYMAIGLGKMMGFSFPENFNSPYTSKSITEFWQRWHITLGSWMRDYLYIPLGGNRVKSKLRLYSNLWIVFLISGLWHGASWNFIVWGAFHGTFLVLDRLFLLRFTSKLPSFFSILLTFFISINGWVLFRAESLSDAASYFKSMYAFNFDFPYYFFVSDEPWLIVSIAFLLGFGSLWNQLYAAYERFINSQTVRTNVFKLLFSLTLIFFSATEIVSSSFNPFIYFRF